MLKTHSFKSALIVGLSSVVALATPSEEAAAQEPSSALQSSSFALVEIPDPRQGHLLHLRGIAGRGTIVFNINGACSEMPVRFVAGDFEGREPGERRGGAIQILITSPDLIGDLMAGADVVSDAVRVGLDPNDGSADVIIMSGLPPETGFVLNPGRSVLADVFPNRPTPITCAETASLTAMN